MNTKSVFAFATVLSGVTYGAYKHLIKRNHDEKKLDDRFQSKDEKKLLHMLARKTPKKSELRQLLYNMSCMSTEDIRMGFHVHTLFRAIIWLLKEVDSPHEEGIKSHIIADRLLNLVNESELNLLETDGPDSEPGSSALTDIQRRVELYRFEVALQKQDSHMLYSAFQQFLTLAPFTEREICRLFIVAIHLGDWDKTVEFAKVALNKMPERKGRTGTVNYSLLYSMVAMASKSHRNSDKQSLRWVEFDVKQVKSVLTSVECNEKSIEVEMKKDIGIDTVLNGIKSAYQQGAVVSMGGICDSRVCLSGFIVGTDNLVMKSVTTRKVREFSVLQKESCRFVIEPVNDMIEIWKGTYTFSQEPANLEILQEDAPLVYLSCQIVVKLVKKS